MLSCSSHNALIVLILVLVLLSSCYERQEGCLDINASNYDFSADDPCDDCCTYPKMKISVTHMWRDTFLMDDSLYYNDLNQYIKIISSKFYLSDFSLLNNSEGIGISEEITVQDDRGGISKVSDDFIFVRSNRVSYLVGTFPRSDIYDGMSFNFGIDGNYVTTDSTKTFVEDPSFFNENMIEHTNFRMEYIIDTVSMDTISLDLQGAETAKKISLSGNLEIPLGTDFTVPIFVYYDRLLHNLNFDLLNTDEGKILLQGNLDHFFSY